MNQENPNGWPLTLTRNLEDFPVANRPLSRTPKIGPEAKL